MREPKFCYNKVFWKEAAVRLSQIQINFPVNYCGILSFMIAVCTEVEAFADLALVAAPVKSLIT